MIAQLDVIRAAKSDQILTNRAPMPTPAARAAALRGAATANHGKQLKLTSCFLGARIFFRIRHG